jgi:hypothetical protein
MAEFKMEHSAESAGNPASVWERYEDVEEWREWSKGIEKSSLDGDFEAGSKGTAKAPNLPRGRFELVEVEPQRRFVSKAKWPGGTLILDHVIEPTDGGTRITHKATVRGPLDFLWSPLIGRIIKRELPASVERLAGLAVEKEEEARQQEQEKEERDARLEKADEEFKASIKSTSRGDDDRGGASLPGAA